MTRKPSIVLLLGAALIASPSAFGVVVFTADLTHSQETVQGPLLTSTGDPRPLSFGTATFTLNDAMTALTFSATIFNIDVTGTQTTDPNDNLVAAHIHASPTAAVGANAPVVWGFFGNPDNDNNPDDLVVAPFGSGVGGTFTSKWDLNEGNGANSLATQLANILSGHSYINFHTTQFTGGEIRGALLIPDSGGSLALLCFGLAGMAGLRRLMPVRIA